jgi:hypothetical protein
MTFIQPINVLRIQEELKKYKELCLAYQHKPVMDEFQEIVNFILLQSGSGTTLGESVETINDSTMEFLYESFIEDFPMFTERIEVGGDEEWDSTVNIAASSVKKVAAGVAVTAAAAGFYVAFLFKKGKLKASIAKEADLEMQKIKMFEKVAALKYKIAELEEREIPALGGLIPSIYDGADPDKPETKE